MVEQRTTWLERLSEWGYRVDTAQDLWPFIKPFVGPAVIGIVTALLRARDHVALSQVFLYGLWGLAAGLVALAAWVVIRGNTNTIKSARSPENVDTVENARRTRVRVDVTNYLRRLYDGDGRQAIGDAFSEADFIVSTLRSGMGRGHCEPLESLSGRQDR